MVYGATHNTTSPAFSDAIARKGAPQQSSDNQYSPCTPFLFLPPPPLNLLSTLPFGRALSSHRIFTQHFRGAAPSSSTSPARHSPSSLYFRAAPPCAASGPV
eukprot:scaffold7681_cov135-Isochrysis_galbana.AAC.1